MPRPANGNDSLTRLPTHSRPHTNRMEQTVLTIPMQPADPSGSQKSASTASVLVIGRSEKVLKETVELIQNNGRAAGATNDFDNVLTQFDIASLNIVVFGGMVPPETKEALSSRPVLEAEAGVPSSDPSMRRKRN